MKPEAFYRLRRRATEVPSRLATVGLAVAGLAIGCRDAVGPIVVYDEKIAFTSIRDRFMRIYTMNPDGSAQAVLTADEQTNLDPSWSPDGAQILFTSWRDGDANIYVMDADGSNPIRLTGHPANDRSARFSPAGGRIAFVGERGGDYDIFVMGADGSNPVNITNSPGTVDVDPQWSPDGSRIVFCSTRGSDPAEPVFSLFTMHPDGSDVRRLPVEGGARSPAWSPDGARIAFVSFRDDGDAEIYVMSADGSAQVNLTRRLGLDELPSWSRSGSHIVFSSKRDGVPDIYVMRADGSDPVNLTRDGFWDAMATWRP